MAYTYKHIRKDNNDVFYVGIGKTKKRLYSHSNRNKHWKNIVNKVGYDAEIIEDNLTWEEACGKEKELIMYYGRFDLGLGKLVNMTNGGDGVNGLIHTAEHRMKNSLSNKNKIVSEETKQKMSKSAKKRGIKPPSKPIGWKHSEDAIKKMSESHKHIHNGDLNNFFGKTHTDEVKEKLRNLRLGKKMSEETKEKISKSNVGKKRKPFSEETKQKMAESAKKRGAKPPSRLGKNHSEETKQKMREVANSKITNKIEYEKPFKKDENN